MLAAVVIFLLTALVLAAGVAYGLDRSGPDATEPIPAPTMGPTSPQDVGNAVAAVPGPDPEALRRVADYISADGRYVKIGDVEISATGPLSRTGPTR
jgi:hypothetical protein